VGDQNVYFCCQGCVEEFKKSPSKYLSKLEEQGYKIKVDENTKLVSK